jgi:hypothetical protein
MTLLLASAITAGWAHNAEAQPSLAPVQEAAPPSTRKKIDYYGWQILLTDASGVAAGIAIGSTGYPGSGLLVFSGGYVLGGPIVHLSHGHPGRALGSLGLRLGLPVLGFSLPLLQDPSCDSEGDCDDLGQLVAALALGVVGMGVASVIDWAVLGTSVEDVPVERGPTLVPQVSAGADGSLQIGVLGRF